MPQSEIEALSDGVAGLRSSVDGLRADVQQLHAYGLRSRTLIARQWIPIVAVIVLALAFGAFAISARRTAQIAKEAAVTAQHNAVKAVDACKTANIARATTRDLWNTIFNFPPVLTLTPAQKATVDAQIAALRVRIAKSYADQDCSKLAPP